MGPKSSIQGSNPCVSARFHFIREGTMPAKGYWIGQVDVTDPERYRAYIAANAVAFRNYGGRFLVRGGASETVDGRGRARVVVIEFKDYATALACYRSAEYAEALALRKGASISDVTIVEGYDGPQPADD